MILPGQAGILEDLRHRILSLQLAPGEALSRQDLAARYGIGSTPLRDALMRLQDEGLIEVRPHARTTVSRIDLDHARQIHVLRSVVEAEVATRLATAPRAGLGGELTRLIDMHDTEARRGTMDAFTQIDLAFHETLFRHADLLHLHRVIRRESLHIDRLRVLHLTQPQKAAQIIRDHRAIAQAIVSGDPAGAGAAMKAHLSQSILFGEQLTGTRPQYFKP